MAFPVRRVPARYFQLLLEILRDNGTDVHRLLELCGLDEDRIWSRDALLSSLEVDTLIRTAGQLTGRQDLGFELGRRIKMNSHDLLGYGLMSCTTVDEFMRMATRHYHLMTETWTLNYRRYSTHGEAIYTPLVAIPPESQRFYMEALALAHQNQIYLLAGPDAPGYDIYINMPQPAHIHRYIALAPVRFHFEAGGMPGLRVVMGAELLSLPLALGDPRVVREIDERCAALGQRPKRADVGWSEYVMMVLRTTRGEPITLEELARRLNVSARTIDRHLKQEGMGFRQLSDKVRFEQACELLGIEGATVSSVAIQLGFSDAANFSRAFKRVMEILPSEHQASLSQARTQEA